MPTTLRQPTFSLRQLLPSGIASIVIHVLLLFVVAAILRGCQKGMTGETGGEVFRRVGIVQSEDDGDQEHAGDQGTADTESEGSPEVLEPVVDPDRQLPQEAPPVTDVISDNALDSSSQHDTVATQLPPLIGAGSPLSGLPPSNSGGLIQPSSAGGELDGGGMELKPGETAFLGVADSGSSFVYVIDTSSSMGEQNRLQVAKNQLKASLRLLQPNQRFQVIFYNEMPSRMKMRSRNERPLYFATAANILVAEREVGQEIPYLGTRHMPALLDALSLAPDVIYFLTDGREPQLSPDDLDQIRRLNPGATIHVIEFTDGALTSRASSWLEKLARQSGGQYRSFNVRALQ
jgi:hypothetical protein